MHELKARGFPSKFINIIKEGYEDFCCKVLHEGQLSDPIKTSSGGQTRMPSITTVVPAGSGRGTAYSPG
jgi:hypothetical protein